MKKNLFNGDPDFSKNLFKCFTTEKNKALAEDFLSKGLHPAAVNYFLRFFYDENIILQSVLTHAKNPEWIEARSWREASVKQYFKAMGSLKKLLSNNLIPAEEIKEIKKDINKLEFRKNWFLDCIKGPKLKFKSKRTSIQKMIIFQSKALFIYLKEFSKKKVRDKALDDLLAELFRNLYQGTLIEEGLKNLNGEKMKKNYIDNFPLDKKIREEHNKKVKGIIKKVSEWGLQPTN